MSFKCVAVATLVTISTAVAAHASSVTTHTFNLSKPSGYVPDGSNSFSIIDNELIGVFTGGFINNYSTEPDGGVIGDFSNDVELRRHNFGAGVCRGAATKSCPGDEPHSVDGATAGVSDFVEMRFIGDSGDVNVRLKELQFGWIGTFEYWDRQYGYLTETGAPTNGAFDLIVDRLYDGKIGEGDREVLSAVVEPISADTRVVSDLIGTVSFGDYPSLSDADLLKSVFGVKAGVGGSWKLLSATVEYDRDAPPVPSIVPLPAAAWLLLAGIGGLAWVGRRRTS